MAAAMFMLPTAAMAWQAALSTTATGGRPATMPISARARPIFANFKQAKQVEVGGALPSVEGFGVELVTDDCAFDDTCAVVDDIDFTKGKSVIVGMPGAFTPTCTDEHLPGFIRNAKKMRRAGVKNIAVLTTNDRFIMTAWKRKMRECAQAAGLNSIDSEISMLADKNGNLIRALGLAYNEALDKNEKNAFIQLNSGIRSKRFALIAQDGVVQHLAVDDGSIDLDQTSAESVLAVLSGKPQRAVTATGGGAGASVGAVDAGESNPAVAAASLAAIAAGAAYYYFTYMQ